MCDEQMSPGDLLRKIRHTAREYKRLLDAEKRGSRVLKGIWIQREESLADSSIHIGSSSVDFHPIKRGERTIGWGLYLSQGNVECPTEFFIPYHEIEYVISALEKAKEMIDAQNSQEELKA